MTPQDLAKLAALGLDSVPTTDTADSYRARVTATALKGWANAEKRSISDPYAQQREEAALRKANRPKRVIASDERNWTERQFQNELNDWFPKNAHLFPDKVLYDCKASPTDSKPFDCIEPSQHTGARKCVTVEGLHHNIESVAYKQQSTKPGDGFYMRSATYYIIIMFNVRQRGNKTFYVIRYTDWMEEQSRSDRKSLTEERAKEIGQQYSL